MILSADIGGTNSRFSLLSTKKNSYTLTVESEKKEKSNNFDSFSSLLAAIKKNDSHYDVSKCSNFVVAVPGAVTSDNLIHLPYVRWKTIDQAVLKRQYPHIVFINDFLAQAYGCLTEATKDALPLSGKDDQKQGDIAVVGAGTGIGHCALRKTGEDSYVCVPSEAGHIPFPFIADDQTEKDFRDFLIANKKITCPVCNDVVSGPGISRLHEFFTGKELQPSEVAQEISPESKTTKYFGKFYGRACRNYVLSTLASGGTLYISGGVAIKNPFLVDNDSFKAEFLQSATTAKELLKQTSVFLIKDERIGLFGAAYYGANIAS